MNTSRHLLRLAGLAALLWLLACGPEPETPQSLVDSINQGFAQQPANLAPFFDRIHSTKAKEIEAIAALQAMLSGGVAVHAAFRDVTGQLLSEDVIPKLDLSVRLDPNNPSGLQLLSTDGQVEAVDLIPIEGRWMMAVEAIGQEFVKELESPETSQIIRLAPEVAKILHLLAEQVQAGQLKDEEAVHTALFTAVQPLMQ